MTESKATDKEREAFEAWAKTKKLLLDRSGVWPDRYSYCQTDDAWDGWRAALSSRDEATADVAVPATGTPERGLLALQNAQVTDDNRLSLSPADFAHVRKALKAAVDAAIASQERAK